MTAERVHLLIIRDAISTLPAAEAEACLKLAEHIRAQIKAAGDVGVLTLALVGAEIQEQQAT